MRIIYQLVVVSFLLFIAISCRSTDKKAQLEKLKKQRDDIEAQIKVLEKESGSNNGLTMRVISVKVTVVKKEPFNHYLEVQGRVDGAENIGVSAQMAGVITALYVKEGDQVMKGQVMAQIDNSVLRQQYESLKTQRDFAANVYARQKALWDQQIGSEIQFLTAKSNKESLEKSVAALDDQIEMTRIKSPVSGRVEEVNLKIGQMAQPGMPAIRVVNFSTVKVLTDIAEAYGSSVKTGADVIVSFPDLNRELKAKVHFTSKYINPVNRTFLTEIRLKPGDIEYRANMIAVVKINDYSNAQAVVIPVSVLRETIEGKYVYVAENVNGQLQARRRLLQTGQSYNGMAEITGGLKPGDLVVTTGFNNLVDGQLLKVN